ncbi:MAG: hypothetical protein ACJ79L_03165 [Anaeromyxobacteraceae bacterium]
MTTRAALLAGAEDLAPFCGAAFGAAFVGGAGLPFSNAAFSPYLPTMAFFVSRPVASITKSGTRRAFRSATHLVISARGRVRRGAGREAVARAPFEPFTVRNLSSSCAAAAATWCAMAGAILRTVSAIAALMMLSMFLVAGTIAPLSGIVGWPDDWSWQFDCHILPPTARSP